MASQPPPKTVLRGEEDEEEDEEEETAPAGAPVASAPRAAASGEDDEEDEEEEDEEDAEAGDDAAEGDDTDTAAAAIDVPDGEGVEAMTGALAALMGAVIKPSLQSLSDRLVELQETQHMLVSTITAQRQDLADGGEAWRESKALLEAFPEYIAKLARIRRTMGATEASLTKTLRSSTQLRAKLEDKERDRAARKAASASAYATK